MNASFATSPRLCSLQPSRPAIPGRSKDEDIQMLASIVRFLQAWRRYNRNLNELNRLGDRELADIGISRSDIPRVAMTAAERA
jgi:uncharacterized protein YjiS (DUF1127 family)